MEAHWGMGMNSYNAQKVPNDREINGKHDSRLSATFHVELSVDTAEDPSVYSETLICADDLRFLVLRVSRHWNFGPGSIERRSTGGD